MSGLWLVQVNISSRKRAAFKWFGLPALGLRRWRWRWQGLLESALVGAGRCWCWSVRGAGSKKTLGHWRGSSWTGNNEGERGPGPGNFHVQYGGYPKGCLSSPLLPVPRVGWCVGWTPLHQRVRCPRRHGSVTVWHASSGMSHPMRSGAYYSLLCYSLLLLQLWTYGPVDQWTYGRGGGPGRHQRFLPRRPMLFMGCLWLGSYSK